MSIRAIIIDDDSYTSEALALQLEKYCPEVKLEGTFGNGLEGLGAIKKIKPDLVFLDVEMPKMNGFEMLEALDEINFELIFTTSYDQYALKAIRFSAIDYLLKPIDREELQKAVQKVVKRTSRPMAQQMEILMQKLKTPSKVISKLAMPTMEGLQMVLIDSIISCESDSNYTILRLKDNHRLIVSRTLKDIEEMLEDHSFARVHHSYMVNLNEIEKYVKGEGGYLLMSDGTTVDVSRSKKEMLLRKLLPGRE